MLEPTLHFPLRRSKLHFAGSLVAHAAMVAVLAQVRAPGPPAPPQPRELTKVTLEPAPRPKFPPRAPRAAPRPPIQRTERALAIPQPLTKREPAPRTTLVPSEAPRIEPESPAPPLLSEAPVPRVEAPPVQVVEPKTSPPVAAFADVRAAAAVREPEQRPVAKGLFSAVLTQEQSRLSVEKARTASAGFGSAGAGPMAAKPAPASTAPGTFGSAAAGSSRISADAVIAKAGFEAVDARREAAPSKEAVKPKAAALEPIRILAKPEPAYTPEARALRLEGDVTVEALFRADGRVEAIHVVQGLGHGLDEAAVAAVAAIRFEPARRAGVPEDARLHLVVRFQLAY